MKDPSASFEFVKVEGAGNDFVLVDGNLQPVSLDSSRVRRLCDRRRGIGADGLLYIEPRGDGELRVRFWNRNGQAAAFCGNGARCVAAALLLNRETRPLHFRLGDFAVEAEPAGPGRFRTLMPAPEGQVLEPGTFVADMKKFGGAPEMAARAAMVTVGVPHLVFLVSRDLFNRPAAEWGPVLSRSSMAGSSRANVNFLFKEMDGWRLRTFERGVEEETLACGSGITASAWALRQWGEASGVISIRPTGGDLLSITAVEEKRRWFLEGPARIVYRGRIDEGR